MTCDNKNPAPVKWLAIVSLGLLFLWFSGFGLFMQYVTSMKPPVDTTPTDAIIVLTGGAQRVNQGLDLLASGQARKMLISGVNDTVSLDHLLALWNRPIIRTNEESCCIILDRKARNTFENASEAAKWLRQEKFSSLRLVTSDYHMPRARLEFSDVLPDTAIVVHTVPSNDGNIDFVYKSFIEYNKTLLTLLKIFLLPDAVKGWIAL